MTLPFDFLLLIKLIKTKVEKGHTQFMEISLASIFLLFLILILAIFLGTAPCKLSTYFLDQKTTQSRDQIEC